MIYFTAYTFKCVCHCRRAMFRVLGMYNFGITPNKYRYIPNKKGHIPNKYRHIPNKYRTIPKSYWKFNTKN